VEVEKVAATILEDGIGAAVARLCARLVPIVDEDVGDADPIL
jgi:hypothetical protein